MFQLILLAAVIYILFQWLRRGTSPPRNTRRTDSPPPAASGPIEEMVQDPVCGTWVPAGQALILERGGETLHFCSAECREKFQLTPKAD